MSSLAAKLREYHRFDPREPPIYHGGEFLARRSFDERIRLERVFESEAEKARTLGILRDSRDS